MFDKFQFVGFWKRVLATIIDSLLGVAILPVTLPILYWCIENKNIWPHVMFSLLWTLIFLVLVVKYGGTPGKLLIGIRIVNKHGKYISWEAAVRRIIPTIIMSILYLLQFKTAIDNSPGFTGEPTFLKMGRMLNEYGGIYTNLSRWSGFFVYIDIGVILFNKKKRAIHDFLAGSFVITKKSYKEINDYAGNDKSTEIYKTEVK